MGTLKTSRGSIVYREESPLSITRRRFGLVAKLLADVLLTGQGDPVLEELFKNEDPIQIASFSLTFSDNITVSVNLSAFELTDDPEAPQ